MDFEFFKLMAFHVNEICQYGMYAQVSIQMEKNNKEKKKNLRC